MRVHKIPAQSTAYLFSTTKDGDNFNELSKDVRNDGGSVTYNGNSSVIIKVTEGEFNVPLGFALVIEGGIGKIINETEFTIKYEQVEKQNLRGEFTKFEEHLLMLQNSLEDLATRLEAFENKQDKSRSKTTKRTQENKSMDN